MQSGFYTCALANTSAQQVLFFIPESFSRQKRDTYILGLLLLKICCLRKTKLCKGFHLSELGDEWTLISVPCGQARAMEVPSEISKEDVA